MSTDPLLSLMAEMNNTRCSILDTPTGDQNVPTPAVVKTGFDVLLLGLNAQQRVAEAADYDQKPTHTAACSDDALLTIGCRLLETHTRSEAGAWTAVATGAGRKFIVLGKEDLSGAPAALGQVQLTLSQESPVL